MTTFNAFTCFAGPRRRRGLRLVLALLLTALGFASCAAASQATSALTFSSFTAGAFNQDGSPSTQAGAHPWEIASTFQLGTIADPDYGVLPDGAVKETIFYLPPGVIGDPKAVPRCREADLPTVSDRCPKDTQIGTVDIDRIFFGRLIQHEAVYNVVPGPGEAVAFHFTVAASVVHVGLKVRSDGDYGVIATVRGINAAAPVFGASLHLWGVPADPSHDFDRFGPSSLEPGPSGLPRKPFLRNPTSCTGPVTTTVHATSWSEPNEPVTAESQSPATTGCAAVPFAPSLSLAPDTRRAGSPAGFNIDLNVPQNENPDGLASSDLKDVAMTLPAGVAINPAAADGLSGCSDAEFAVSSSDAGHCTNASKIGTLEIKTPLLENPLTGSLFLAAPLEQGTAAAASGRMFRVFLEAEGVATRIKRVGTIVPDPVTGQLTVTFNDNPQLPFETLHVAMNGGPRAPLTTPRACGTYATHSELTPWARPTEPVGVDSSFTIDENCGAAGSFSPTLEAGTIGSQAGSSSPFAMTLTRPDGQQGVSSLRLVLPPGLTGKLAGIPLCPEAQANAGTCSAESQIGKVTAAAGAGPNPLYVPQPGRTPTAVYLAGPYKGAPFSLSVVVPAEAGPFDLGTVVVRAALFVDRNDAHVSVVSDPIPTILDGVPLNVQKINVTLDRPGFMVSPTNCTPMQIAGTATSSAGQSAALSSPFQVGSCAALKFAPKFSVSTVGQASKANGASLTTKLSFPANQGTQANVTKVKVELPRQLPSRLTTLQKACTSAQFDANPAGCPAASFIGHATVHTPLLPVPLTGPAIFVSHGGEAFPSLVMVLQGYGVTVDLVGTTLIRGGVTSTTFKTVPDVPFSAFELTLGQGKFSALGANLPQRANYSFCGQKMAMPTEFVGQNGALIKQSTPIAITGCAKAKATKAQKLAATLRACRKKSKSKRAVCARAARRQGQTTTFKRGGAR